MDSDFNTGLIFCSYCGRVVAGDNDGIILGYGSWVDKSLDFSRSQPQEVIENFELIKFNQKQVTDSFLTTRGHLEEFEFTTGKFYRKTCYTLRYNRSYDKTLNNIVNPTRVPESEYISDLREKLVRCGYCGKIISGYNNGVITGFYSLLDNAIDFTKEVPEELRKRYEIIKADQKNSIDKLEILRKNLEDIGWIYGKFAKKTAKTLFHAKDYLKQFKDKIESGENYAKN